MTRTQLHHRRHVGGRFGEAHGIRRLHRVIRLAASMLLPQRKRRRESLAEQRAQFRGQRLGKRAAHRARGDRLGCNLDIVVGIRHLLSGGGIGLCADVYRSSSIRS
jgi:hypothetical protein